MFAASTYNSSTSKGKGKGRAVPEDDVPTPSTSSPVPLVPLVPLVIQTEVPCVAMSDLCDCSMCLRRAEEEAAASGMREGSWSDASSSTAGSLNSPYAPSPSSTVASAPPLTPESGASHSPAISVHSFGAGLSPVPGPSQVPQYTNFAHSSSMTDPVYQAYASQNASFSLVAQPSATQTFNHPGSNSFVERSVLGSQPALGKRRREGDDSESDDAPSAKRFQFNSLY